MKYIIWIGCFIGIMSACLREKYRGNDCWREVFFVMKDVPYVFVGDEAVAYKPYYTFVEQLKLYIFSDQKLNQNFKYSFDYCREHPVIAQNLEYNSKEALFVANLFDSKALDWSFKKEKLQAVFSIIDFEEPPVLLAAIAEIDKQKDSIPVELRMLVSRLEIRLTNPPAWVTGLEITVKNIAASVSADYILGDTTHIYKQMAFNNQGAGTYQFGVNTFPTYTNKPAILTILPTGTSETSPILVDDSRLHLLPGVITRLDIVYETENKITVSIEIDGKWEVVDGGSIII